jgi:hypothetical protein
MRQYVRFAKKASRQVQIPFGRNHLPKPISSQDTGQCREGWSLPTTKPTSSVSRCFRSHLC